MFTKARITLTAWYLLIIMCISMSFSFVVYHALTRELNRITKQQQLRNNRFFPPPLLIIDPELITETKQRIIFLLGIVNVSIFTLSGVLGYMLAGRTLSPISKMIDEQNQFISDASHELRTPLTALKTSLEVHLRDKQLNLKDARNVISESITEVNTLQRLSDSLLNLFHHQQPDASTPETIFMNDLLHEAIKKIQPLADAKKIKIIKSETPHKIIGFQNKLVDMLVILLDNAIKYSNPETEIAIHTKDSKNNLIIMITDHGIGIDKKHLPHIFDRFYRANSSRGKDKAAGYGLGLSIALHIAQIHNGTISVSSKVGIGSTFTVTLSHSFSKYSV